MWKQVVIYTFSGFIALILIFIILFSNEIASLIFYQPYPNKYYNKEDRAQELWETTLGKKLSLLREKVSLCNIRGGKRIQTNHWTETPRKYKCHLPYSDKGKPCQNSNECQGECLVVSPKIDDRTYHFPSEDTVLKEFNCTGLGVPGEWSSETENVYETYLCEKNLFEARCSTFSFDKNNQWEINNNKINYFLYWGEDVGL